MLMRSELAPAPRPQDMRQNVITERKDPSSPVSAASGGFYSRGAINTGPSKYKLYKSLEKRTPQTCLLTPRYKMKIPKSKFN